jgi:hypothetical protein
MSLLLTSGFDDLHEGLYLTGSLIADREEACGQCSVVPHAYRTRMLVGLEPIPFELLERVVQVTGPDGDVEDCAVGS